MSVNQVAFFTVVGLGVVTGGAAIAAAVTANTVALIAYTILAITAGGASLASVTAWLDATSTDAGTYFQNMQKHATIAIAGLYTFVAQTLLQSLIQGIANGVSKVITRKIAGPDITIN